MDFGITASQNMSLAQFDVATAFLYGEPEENIYMKQREDIQINLIKYASCNEVYTD